MTHLVMFYPKNHTPQVKFGVPSGQIKFGCFCRFSALLAVHSALEEKAIAEYHDIHIGVFNLYDIYPPQTSARHTQTPSRHCQTSSNTIQTPAYLACGRLLGEKAIDEYHEIYLAVFNLKIPYLFDCFQFILHLPTPNICQEGPDTTQKLSDTIQTHLRHPHIWPVGGHREKRQYMNTMIIIQICLIFLTSTHPRFCQT